MASIKDIGRGKSRVTWYDTTGRQHRSILLKSKAQELYEKVCAQRLFDKAGISPTLGVKAQNIKRMTVYEVATAYREYLAGTRAKANVSYIDRITDKWGDWRIAQLTTGQVRAWLYTLLNDQTGKGALAVSTVRKLAVYFIRIFNYSIEELEQISQNPLNGLINQSLRKEFKRVNKRSTTISSEEFWCLIKDFPVWMRRVCICAWSTGMRLDEILNLTWGKVDLVQRLISLQASDTKEADNKRAGIEQDLYDVLIEIQTERSGTSLDDFVFLSVKGRKINQNFFERKFRKHSDKAGYTGLWCHDFRHCYTTRKRREGHTRSVIKAQTGHHTDSMFDWYDKVDVSEIQEMAGFTQANCESVKTEIDRVIHIAQSTDIPMGAVQALIARLWRQSHGQSHMSSQT